MLLAGSQLLVYEMLHNKDLVLHCQVWARNILTVSLQPVACSDKPLIHDTSLQAHDGPYDCDMSEVGCFRPIATAVVHWRHQAKVWASRHIYIPEQAAKKLCQVGAKR